MRNSTQSRNARRAYWAGVLASWPLVATSACSIYDASMLDGAAAPLGGSAAEAGSAGISNAGSGAVGAGAAGGAASGSAGEANGGKAGDAPNVGGSAGAPLAGSGGSSGSPMGGSAGSTTVGSEVIDDMEDGDAEIEISGPRNGYWYVGGDLTKGATLEPPSSKFAMAELTGDRSTSAAHIKATGFADWGSVMGFNFIELLTKVKTYDASVYCGISFWGKAAAATTVRFRIPDVNTHQAGGVCTDPGTTGTSCYDHFGSSLSFSAAWKQYTVKFSDVAQVGSGYHPADGKLKVQALMAVEWALPGGTTKTYEIWIDDVQFTKCD